MAEELGAEVKRMNARIIALDHKEILRAQEYAVFLTIFLSCIQRATRMRCGDGPVMVPASSKITQSLLLMLSGWMGTRSFEGFFRMKPTVSSVVCVKPQCLFLCCG
jgi:hypothetical protein